MKVSANTAKMKVSGKAVNYDIDSPQHPSGVRASGKAANVVDISDASAPLKKGLAEEQERLLLADLELAREEALVSDGSLKVSRAGKYYTPRGREDAEVYRRLSRRELYLRRKSSLTEGESEELDAISGKMQVMRDGAVMKRRQEEARRERLLGVEMADASAGEGGHGQYVKAPRAVADKLRLVARLAYMMVDEEYIAMAAGVTHEHLTTDRRFSRVLMDARVRLWQEVFPEVRAGLAKSPNMMKMFLKQMHPSLVDSVAGDERASRAEGFRLELDNLKAGLRGESGGAKARRLARHEDSVRELDDIAGAGVEEAREAAGGEGG